MSNPSNTVSLTANGSSTNELVVGKAEHANGATYSFRVGIAPGPDAICMGGGRIRLMRIERAGQMRYLFANGSRRLFVMDAGLEDVIASLRNSFN